MLKKVQANLGKLNDYFNLTTDFLFVANLGDAFFFIHILKNNKKVTWALTKSI